MSAAAATQILAIRHGQTAWNAAARIQGHQDIALDAVGLRQADALARALHGETLAAVYSSDLLRARQTAQALQASSSGGVQIDPGLRERSFGSFEGFTFAEIESRWPAEAERWRRRDADLAPGGGESLRDFQSRCLETVTRLARLHRGQSIALVTHGGVLDMLYRAARRIELQAPRDWPLGNAAVNRLQFDARGLVIVSWNDGRHLAAS